MKYALGNMLNGAGGLNADQLALDLPFAATKSLTAAKGPTPTFTRASSATFVGSDGLIQSAGSNIARFDHDPVTLVCKGLLIEESRTNLQPHSSDYTQTTTSWSTTTGMNTAVLASTISPDGTQNGVLISENTASGLHRISSRAITGTSQPYTVSIFVKAGPSPRRYISFGFVFQNFRVIWDTQTSSFAGVTPGTTAPTSYSSQNFGNGWHRLLVTATLSAGSIGVGALLYNGTEFYTGDGTSNAYLWGAQLEAGSFPTSYIPTTTASLGRSADVCSITNTSSFWNNSEFTLFTNANLVTSGVDVYASNFQIAGLFFGARRTFTNQAIAIIRSSGVTTDIVFGPFTTGSMRMASAYTAGQAAGSLNGASTIQQNSAFVPSSNPPFNIGYSGASAYINGHVVAIRYYRKRLPNAKLQALTA